ncbi:hypothetical protein J3R82DRAFT_10188 [Butyriboletus roseoflavus]|nr:hypothetical protein J3R82DRAFT_10188 [Butyriboletus roseoflavus]
MHHALYIQEILLHIFGHCCPTESHWTPNRLSFTTDLAVLARTCRAFKEPALDVLWSELVDLSPLVRCLPGACQSLGLSYSFKRQLNETEWETLRSYTRRVWHITGYSNLHGWLDSDNFIAICNTPIMEPLFPNLRSLYWQGMAMIPVTHIAVPSLTSLDLHFRRVPVLNNFLDSVGELSPNITRFRIYVFQCQILHEAICSHICRWANLRVLDFHGVIVDATMVSRLSEISGLTYLSFTLIPGVTDWIPSSGSVSVFPRLMHLEMASESLGPVTGLLSCTQLPVLQNLVVVCPRCPSKEVFRSYMTTVQNVCSPESLINFLFFNNKSPRLPLSGTPDSESDGQLTLDDLRPCMGFVNLWQLRVDIKWSVALTDSDLVALVSAWPRVQYLHINEEWGWRTTGGITLRGLVELLERSRSLSLLCIAIHAESFTELPHDLDEALVPSMPLRILLADSVIRAADVPALVDVFVGLRVYLRFFVALNDVAMVNRVGAEGRGGGWRQVFDGVNERLWGPSRAAGGE